MIIMIIKSALSNKSLWITHNNFLKIHIIYSAIEKWNNLIEMFYNIL